MHPRPGPFFPKMLGASHSSKVRKVKPTLSRTPVIGNTTIEPHLEARVPHGVGASPVTPAHVTTARSPGLQGWLSNPQEKKWEGSESCTRLQPIQRRTDHYVGYRHPHRGKHYWSRTFAYYGGVNKLASQLRCFLIRWLCSGHNSKATPLGTSNRFVLQTLNTMP